MRLDIRDFGAQSDAPRSEDATSAVRAALRALHDLRDGLSDSPEDRQLTFPPGTYHFWPDRAEEHYLFISNNDEGLKRIAFPLFDIDGLTIDGQGSTFFFHGFLVPFALRDCAHIRLTGFTLDWERTFHSEGTVLAAREGSVDLEFSPAFPYAVERERLSFLNEMGEKMGLGAPLEFDPKRRETAFKVYDSYAVRGGYHRTEELGPGRVRFHAELRTLPTPGNILVLPPDHRLCPAITVGDSRDIVIDNITLRHSGGMGIIAQRTENVSVRNMAVTPGPGRMVSLTADATHFVNCRGRIEMTGCRFENQMDDATNVHGIYARIARRIGGDTIEVETVHPQQSGIAVADYRDIGDSLEFVRGESLQSYHEAIIVEAGRLNKRFTRIRLATALPDNVRIGDAVQSLSRQPDITIRNCVSRGNRARGFLVSTRGETLIENNHFHTAGAAILIEGDASHWFESGAVQNVGIRGNHFDNCNYGVWGQATIQVSPRIEPPHRGGNGYHRNIHIENNLFKTFHDLLIKAHSVDGLAISGNRIRSSSDYPPPEIFYPEPFSVSDSQNVRITENRYEPFADVDGSVEVTLKK